MSVFNNKKLSVIESKNRTEKKHTILIVDDEEYNLKTLSSLLSEQYNILEANDGQSALDLIKSLDDPSIIHLIISDQRMPNLTGVELLEQSQTIIPHAKSIILTGFSDVDIIIQAINQCCIFKFMLKPFEQYDLLLTVQRALEAYNLEAKNIALMRKLLSLNNSLEKEVKEKNALLEKQYTTLVTIASHDLRKPLMLVQDIIETIQQGITNNSIQSIEDIQEDLTLIADSNSYMSDITENYLDTQIITTGHLKLIIKETDIHKLINDVIKYNHANAQRKKITLHNNVDNTPLLIQIDKTRISQVLDNLIGNAIKFCSAENNILVNTQVKDQLLKISITDTGPGISEQDKQKLFTKFAKLSNKPTGNEVSLGLGLYICKQIMELHKGTIHATDNPEGGSIFTLTLPLSSS